MTDESEQQCAEPERVGDRDGADDLATARDALVRGLQGVPGHEKLYRLRMQLEHRCVGPTAVHGVFNDLTHQLDALDCEPSEETLATYHQLTGRRAAS